MSDSDKRDSDSEIEYEEDLSTENDTNQFDSYLTIESYITKQLNGSFEKKNIIINLLKYKTAQGFYETIQSKTIPISILNKSTWDIEDCKILLQYIDHPECYGICRYFDIPYKHFRMETMYAYELQKVIVSTFPQGMININYEVNVSEYRCSIIVNDNLVIELSSTEKELHHEYPPTSTSTSTSISSDKLRIIRILIFPNKSLSYNINFNKNNTEEIEETITNSLADKFIINDKNASYEEILESKTDFFCLLNKVDNDDDRADIRDMIELLS